MHEQNSLSFLCLRSSSTSPSATLPCPSTSTVTSPTGCTTPSSAMPSPLLFFSVISTTRLTVASSLRDATPPLPPRRQRLSPTATSTASTKLLTGRRLWGARRRNPRRTLEEERGKDVLKEIRGRGGGGQVRWDPDFGF